MVLFLYISWFLNLIQISKNILSLDKLALYPKILFWQLIRRSQILRKWHIIKWNQYFWTPCIFILHLDLLRSKFECILLTICKLSILNRLKKVIKKWKNNSKFLVLYSYISKFLDLITIFKTCSIFICQYWLYFWLSGMIIVIMKLIELMDYLSIVFRVSMFHFHTMHKCASYRYHRTKCPDCNYSRHTPKFLRPNVSRHIVHHS